MERSPGARAEKGEVRISKQSRQEEEEELGSGLFDVDEK